MHEPDLFGDLVPAPEPREAPQPERRRRAPAPRLDAEVWRALLACEETAAAYTAATYRRGETQCWFWTAALSDSGHGKLKAGRAAPGAAAGRTVSAHVYGYQRLFGLITPTADNPDPVVAHRCDEPSCQQPRHWQLTTRAENVRDYHRRKHRWPLNDVRTTAGRKSARAEALREAIRQAQGAQWRVRELWEQGQEIPPALTLETDVEVVLHRASETGRPPEAFETLALF